jgi:transposase
VSRDVISDEVWAVIGPLFPQPKATGRPPVDRRAVVEATAWRYRTGAPWRDVPDRFGHWNTIYKNFSRWAEAGVWARLLESVQSLAYRDGEVDWVTAIDSTIVRVHQHGATLPRPPAAPAAGAAAGAKRGSVELQEVRPGA